MKTTLYLARHGETTWNKMGRLQGQLNSELTELGQQQASNIASTLKHKNIDVIFCSSLDRAVQTAHICQQHLAVEVNTSQQLVERHLGVWQGKAICEIKSDKHFNEVFYQLSDLAVEQGESAIMCAERIYKAIESLAEKARNQTALVIGHGEALRCFFSYISDKANSNRPQSFANGSINTVIYHHKNKYFEPCFNS